LDTYTDGLEISYQEFKNICDLSKSYQEARPKEVKYSGMAFRLSTGNHIYLPHAVWLIWVQFCLTVFAALNVMKLHWMITSPGFPGKAKISFMLRSLVIIVAMNKVPFMIKPMMHKYSKKI
jgi:hypothetical protein